jgi:uncharacterized protein
VEINQDKRDFPCYNKGIKSVRPEEIIEKLNLIPLADEGGYYKQTWVSDVNLESRPLGTAIYFLLVNSYEGFSALHTLMFPEIYHFYLGDPVELSLFHKDGSVQQIILGKDITNGQLPQFVVPPNVVQGSRLVEGGEFALLGTTMTPGYKQNDFYLNSRKEMINQYPDYKNLIISLSREE